MKYGTPEYVEYKHQYYLKNKDKWNYNSSRYKEYYQKNKEKMQAKSRASHKKKKNNGKYQVWLEKTKNIRSLKGKRYRELNKESITAKKRKLRQTNVQYRLSCILRTRICHAVKRLNIFKNGSSVKDLGCTIPELKFYLEGKFKEGMSWENYGMFGWHIDHIIPLAFFDLTDRKQFLQACHYTNLQPLWAKENYQKKDKLNYYDRTNYVCNTEPVEENISTSR